MVEDLTKRRINYGWTEFKNAKRECQKQIDIMEYWFRRCLLLEDVQELVGVDQPNSELNSPQNKGSLDSNRNIKPSEDTRKGCGKMLDYGGSEGDEYCNGEELCDECHPQNKDAPSPETVKEIKEAIKRVDSGDFVSEKEFFDGIQNDHAPSVEDRVRHKSYKGASEQKDIDQMTNDEAEENVENHINDDFGSEKCGIYAEGNEKCRKAQQGEQDGK